MSKPFAYDYDGNTATTQKSLFKWKGQTINTRIPYTQKNDNKFTSMTTVTPYFNPLPLKIYRKELNITAPAKVTPTVPQRLGVSDFEHPGGYVVTSKSGLPNNVTYGIIDINYENNRTYNPGACSSFDTNGVCLTVENNALKRVRSAGMIRKPTQYFTTSAQYLKNRRLSFYENTFR